jgi:hypothetical protein
MRKGLGIGCGTLALLLAILVIIAAATSRSGSQAPSAHHVLAAHTPSTGPRPTTTPSSAPTPVQPKVLLDLTGSGIKASAPFNAPSHWKLAYTYDCSSVGGKGNFIVSVYQGDNFSDDIVNELGASGNSSTDVYTSGEVHLEIDSECSWHVTATTA